MHIISHNLFFKIGLESLFSQKSSYIMNSNYITLVDFGGFCMIFSNEIYDKFCCGPASEETLLDIFISIYPFAIKRISSASQYIERIKKVSIDASLSKYRSLTSSEKNVLKMMLSGLSKNEVANMLNLKIKTIGNYKINALHKLGLDNFKVLYWQYRQWIAYFNGKD